MATEEPETTPTLDPLPTEEGKTESNPEVTNPEHCIKRPLQNRWALWFLKSDESKTWQANLWLISKFDTVEDVWDGIEPMWEHENNKRGGRWLITLSKQQRRKTLLCLIRESFDDYSDDACGAVVNVKAKGDKIAIWTSECENREAVTHIGRTSYKYQAHADTATKSGSSTTKNRFVV
uniref:Eukaryotic translation initiation factor 4E family member 1B n=1 Tax=Propithecus coquereli TaxID=379532 RepID=A0A2K6GJ26_PROCO